jgi:hypothetical protein
VDGEKKRLDSGSTDMHFTPDHAYAREVADGTLHPFDLHTPTHARSHPMAKLKLDVDKLQVDSFETEKDGKRARGTVRANADTQFPCTWDTCYKSCGWSEIDCYTQGCRTDWQTCGAYGSCCPAICE